MLLSRLYCGQCVRLIGVARDAIPLSHRHKVELSSAGVDKESRMTFKTFSCKNRRFEAIPSDSRVRRKRDKFYTIPALPKEKSLTAAVGQFGVKHLETDGHNSNADLTRQLDPELLKERLSTLQDDSGIEHMLGKGLTTNRFMQKMILQSFVQYCITSNSLPPELHACLLNMEENSDSLMELLPFIVEHGKLKFPGSGASDFDAVLTDLQQLCLQSLVDPVNWYTETRQMKRKIIYHCGPTNSGKTYTALQSFMSADTGIYLAPLRLLAIECCEKTNAQGVPCDLLTGERKYFAVSEDEPSNHKSCTIELLDYSVEYDVAVIDEIQMIGNLNRGGHWTTALLGVMAKEIHVCGDDSALKIVKSLVKQCGDKFEVKQYERMSPLVVQDKALGDLTNVKAGDCIVCFNVHRVFSTAEQLRKLGHNCALIYGALPPGVKMEQTKLFNDPNNSCNILVATDAVGMGLNLSIQRMIFSEIEKVEMQENKGELTNRFTKQSSVISVSQAKQIAGRAGRGIYGEAGGEVTTFREKDLHVLKNLLSKNIPDIKTLYGTMCETDQPFFMCDMSAMMLNALLIDDIEMPVMDKFTFCQAPLRHNLSSTSKTIFTEMARRVSTESPITLSWFLQEAGFQMSELENMQYFDDGIELFHLTDVYQWLSFKFSVFKDFEEMREFRNKLDKALRSYMEHNYTDSGKLNMKYLRGKEDTINVRRKQKKTLTVNDKVMSGKQKKTLMPSKETINEKYTKTLTANDETTKSGKYLKTDFENKEDEYMLYKEYPDSVSATKKQKLKTKIEQNLKIIGRDEKEQSAKSSKRMDVVKELNGLSNGRDDSEAGMAWNLFKRSKRLGLRSPKVTKVAEINEDTESDSESEWLNNQKTTAGLNTDLKQEPIWHNAPTITMSDKMDGQTFDGPRRSKEVAKKSTNNAALSNPVMGVESFSDNQDLILQNFDSKERKDIRVPQLRNQIVPHMSNDQKRTEILYPSTILKILKPNRKFSHGLLSWKNGMKIYTMSVVVDGEKFEGKGKTKSVAGARAAHAALTWLINNSSIWCYDTDEQKSNALSSTGIIGSPKPPETTRSRNGKYRRKDRERVYSSDITSFTPKQSSKFRDTARRFDEMQHHSRKVYEINSDKREKASQIESAFYNATNAETEDFAVEDDESYTDSDIDTTEEETLEDIRKIDNDESSSDSDKGATDEETLEDIGRAVNDESRSDSGDDTDDEEKVEDVRRADHDMSSSDSELNDIDGESSGDFRMRALTIFKEENGLDLKEGRSKRSDSEGNDIADKETVKDIRRTDHDMSSSDSELDYTNGESSGDFRIRALAIFKDENGLDLKQERVKEESLENIGRK